MDYKVSKPTAAMIDAFKDARGIYNTIYRALMQDYSEDDVLKMMNGGFVGALDALQEEIFKLMQISIVANLDDEEKNEYVTVLENDLIINKDNYIEEISLHLKKWTFERLSYLEQAILLVATSEIKKEIASKNIIIDEAIRIAKMYCDEKS